MQTPSKTESSLPLGERARNAGVRAIFNALGKDTLHLVDELYAADVQFADPFHRIKGREPLRAYYRNMYANIEEIRFDFEGETATMDELVLYWTMTYRHPRLNGGKPVSLPGCSRLQFVVDAHSNDNGKVCLHRDYFDAGALLYEHIPLLGRAVRFVRERV